MNWKPLIPKEHAIWAILMVPAFTSVFTLGKLNSAFVFLFLSSFFFTVARYPVLLVVKRWQKKENNLKEPLVWATIYLSLSLLLFLPLPILYKLYVLGYFLMVPVIFLGLNVIQVWQKTQREMLNEIIGIIGVTLIAPASYYAIAGSYHHLPQSYLWLGSILYFAGTVFYVKSKTTGRPYAIVSLIYYSCTILIPLCVSIWHPYPWYIALAYVPAFLKTLHSFLKGYQKVPIRTVGFIELGHSIAFGLLFGLLLSTVTNLTP